MQENGREMRLDRWTGEGTNKDEGNETGEWYTDRQTRRVRESMSEKDEKK